MGKGARIGYWRGSIAGLIDDIQARWPLSACPCANPGMADAKRPRRALWADPCPHSRQETKERHIYSVSYSMGIARRLSKVQCELYVYKPQDRESHPAAACADRAARARRS